MPGFSGRALGRASERAARAIGNDERQGEVEALRPQRASCATEALQTQLRSESAGGSSYHRSDLVGYTQIVRMNHMKIVGDIWKTEGDEKPVSMFARTEPGGSG